MSRTTGVILLFVGIVILIFVAAQAYFVDQEINGLHLVVGFIGLGLATLGAHASSQRDFRQLRGW